MEPGSRHWDRAGLERKVRATGRPWTVGDIAVVADSQWAAGMTTAREDAVATVVECRVADGRSMEMTLEELARALGVRFGDVHREEETG